MNFSKPKGILEYAKIKSLYRRAFPICERKPFSIIRKMQKKGKSDIWYFSDESGFLGLATTINSDKIVLIDYFAVTEKQRGRGKGTEMLRALIRHYSPRAVFLEIEIPYESADNYAERVRRKNFYINAGLTPMGTRARLFGVDMELLGVGCTLNFDEYRNFYLENYGRFAYDNITSPHGE